LHPNLRKLCSANVYPELQHDIRVAHGLSRGVTARRPQNFRKPVWINVFSQQVQAYVSVLEHVSFSTLLVLSDRGFGKTVRDRLIGMVFTSSSPRVDSDAGLGNRQKSGSALKPRKSWTLGKGSPTVPRRETWIKPGSGKLFWRPSSGSQRNGTDSPTVSEWLERWIRTERGAVAGRTMMRYEQIVRDFLSNSHSG